MQKQPSCVWPQKATMSKDKKSRGQPRNGCHIGNILSGEP